MAGVNGSATELYTISEAAKLIDGSVGANSQIIRSVLARGLLKAHGERERRGSLPPARLVSLPEVMEVLRPLLEKRASGKPMGGRRPKPAEQTRAAKRAKAAPVEAPEKPKRRSSFGREEVRHFATSVMEGLLNASSITITARGDGTFEVKVTPRIPASKEFSV